MRASRVDWGLRAHLQRPAKDPREVSEFKIQKGWLALAQEPSLGILSGSKGGIAKWLRRRIANPRFPGSSPGAASNIRIAKISDFARVRLRGFSRARSIDAIDRAVLSVSQGCEF
jgi:hypothetical protein